MIRKGCGFMGGGCLTVIVGAALCGFLIFSKLSGMMDKVIQVPGPGTQEITLTKVGTYTIFYEHRSEYRGKLYDTRPWLDSAKFTVTSKEDGQELSVRGATMTSNYSMGSRQGKSVAEFDVARPGVYSFTSEVAAGPGDQEVIFGVTCGFLEEMMGTVGMPIVVGLISFLVAAVLLIVGIIRWVRAAPSAPAA